MNPRRVHQNMRKHFPPFDAVDHEWINVADASGPRINLLDDLLAKYFSSKEVIIEVHRKLGDLLPIDEAAAFVGSNIGKGNTRVSDRAFTSFVVVAVNGAATGWKATANPVLPPTANGDAVAVG